MNFKSLAIPLVILLMAACSPRRGVPYTEPLQANSAEVQKGMVLFDSYCSPCHPGGSSGLGPAINNKPLPGFLIRFQIRHGVGAMPAFSEEVISDEQSKMIVAYLKKLRKLD